jgi:site-specific DNA-methyltransferase (adenine-specific)
MGSGTTGDIAVRLNRNFVGIEMSNDYFQMSKDRIEKAELQASLIQQFTPNNPIDAKDDIDNVW